MKTKDPTLIEIGRKINAFVESITPTGARLLIEYHTPTYFLDWTLCCDGSISDMGYQCGYSPDHKGRCYTFVKDVPFDRD